MYHKKYSYVFSNGINYVKHRDYPSMQYKLMDISKSESKTDFT